MAGGPSGVEIISRDRASTYALAANQAAPQAVQVADRWHLLKNLGDTIQRVLDSNRPAMKQAADEVAKRQIDPVSESTDTAIKLKESPLSHRQQWGGPV